MTFRVAVVQPITHRPPDDQKNVADAAKAIERAAAEGGRFRLFPRELSGSVANAGKLRSDFPAGASGSQASHSRRVRNSRDEVGSSAVAGAKQGVLGAQWQRPELCDTLRPRPSHGTVMPEAAE
jgi:hypothetical protein